MTLELARTRTGQASNGTWKLAKEHKRHNKRKRLSKGINAVNLGLRVSKKIELVMQLILARKLPWSVVRCCMW